MKSTVYWRPGFLGLLVGGVWIFHGLWSKVLGQIPRHEGIVGRVLGESVAAPATIVIGLGEIALGIWVFSGLFRRSCATLQTVALVTMNTLEILLARDLLISAPGMVALNLCFLGIVWYWALHPPTSGQKGSEPDRTNESSDQRHFRLSIDEPAGVYRLDTQVIMNNLRTGVRSDLASAIYEPERGLPTTGVLMANSLPRIP